MRTGRRTSSTSCLFIIAALFTLGCQARPTPAPIDSGAAERHRADDIQLRTDWARLARYRAANAELPMPATNDPRVVFMGNSIFEAWAPLFPAMFPGKAYFGRGISGQTTPQLLVRFRQDVIDLHPAVVVILAGTNDIAGNAGPATLEMIEGNIASMAELAHANGIRVVLGSVLPVFRYPWAPAVMPPPAQTIVALNQWMRTYAAAHGAVYADWHSAMADARLGMRADLSADGVHPNEAGYRVMAPIVERAIAEALLASHQGC
jgi:lysophospholipase L1-like esterase